jgi:hypothetical protein
MRKDKGDNFMEEDKDNKETQQQKQRRVKTQRNIKTRIQCVSLLSRGGRSEEACYKREYRQESCINNGEEQR